MRLCGRILVISAVAVHAAAADAQVTWPAVPHHELQSPTGLDESSHKGVFDQRRAEDRGTEAIPFVVKELPRERSQEEKIEAQEKAALDRRLTERTDDLAFYTKYLFLATLLLAALTGGLASAAFIQMRGARRSIAAAEAAAKAANRNADISERALVELEAPFLYARITNPGLTVTENKRGGGLPSNYSVTFGPSRFVFSNYGRTPARISSYFETTEITERTADAGVMPEPIDIDAVEDYQIPEGVVVLPNGGDSKEYEFSAMNYAFTPPFDPNRKSLFFMGFVRYRDVFGNRYRTGFCFVFDHRQSAFVLIGDEPYNYRCREQIAE